MVFRYPTSDEVNAKLILPVAGIKQEFAGNKLLVGRAPTRASYGQAMLA